MAESCEGIVISAEASYGNDPVPLYEAGSKNISCVIEIEQMATISVSRAVFSQRFYSDGDGSSVTYGNLTLQNPVVKYSLSAQSGNAYFMSSYSAVGKKA